MDQINQDTFELAEKHFEAGHYADAEKLLNQLILDNFKNARVFHMLGTILYDRGKFNKALRCFRRSIEIDPSFTDASIGLSIILNDLGKYDEGKQVFEEAKTMLKHSSNNEQSLLQEQIAIKHDELGVLYQQINDYDSALAQYKQALQLSTRTAELTMKIADCYIQKENYRHAILILKELLSEFPSFYSARIKLGKLYYDSQHIPEAINEWEHVLRQQPDNAQTKDYLNLAQSIDTVHLQESFLTPNAEV